MDKIIILSDVHINDYRRYNINDTQYRLKQFIHLAYWIQSLKADKIIICGDMCDISSPPPHVFHTVLEFLSILTVSGNKYIDVYITPGQHELFIRDNHELFNKNTYLTVADMLPNVRYLHRQKINIYGKSLYFKGYESNYNLDELDKCDILIGHATLCAKTGSSEYTIQNGTKLDSSKFKLAFIGDIHRHQILDDGKVIIPGTPLQNNFNDYSNVGIISLDVDNLKWRFIPTPNEINGVKRLKFLSNSSGLDNPYIITRKVRSNKKIESVGAKNRVNIKNPLELLDKTIRDNDKLIDIHRDVLDNVKLSESIPDLYFHIKNLKISNYLTIKSFELDFDDIGNIVLISGDNGSGKSSLLNAICYVLFGTTSPKDDISWNEKEMYVKITLEYNNNVYNVIRGIKKSYSYIDFEINGESYNRATYTETCKLVCEELQFLSYSDLYVFGQYRHGFLANYNYNDRIKLISKILNIDVLSELYTHVIELQKTQVKLVRELENKIRLVNNTINELNILENKMSINSIDENSLINEVNSMYDKKECIEIKLTKVQKKLVEYKDSINKYNRLYIEYTKNIEKLGNNLNTTKENRCYTCNNLIGVEKSTNLANEINNKIIENKRLLGDLNKPSSDKVNLYEKSISNLKVSSRELSKLIIDKKAILKNIDQNRGINDRLRINEKKLENLSKEYDIEVNILNNIRDYLDIIKPSGHIVENILDDVANTISNSNFTIVTKRKLKRKDDNIRLDFEACMNINGRQVRYDRLSCGQKVITDMYILFKLYELVGGVGLLLLDETLKPLDFENTELAVDILQKIMVDKCFIVSHLQNFPVYNTLIKSTINNNISNYSL